MDLPDGSSDVEKPLDPAAQRLQVKMRRLILISSLTMVLGLISVFVAILYRINRLDDTETAKFTQSVTIPADQDLISATVSEGRIILHLRGTGRDSIHLFDEISGEPLGTIAVDKK